MSGGRFAAPRPLRRLWRALAALGLLGIKLDRAVTAAVGLLGLETHEARLAQPTRVPGFAGPLAGPDLDLDQKHPRLAGSVHRSCVLQAVAGCDQGMAAAGLALAAKSLGILAVKITMGG